MMVNRAKTIVNTYCPVFPGFYNTIFEGNTEGITDINDIDISDVLVNNDLIDWAKYYKDCSKEIVNIIENRLKDLGLIESMEYQALISPQYYNYSNDSIDVIITLNTENKDNIKNYIYSNKDDFAEYLKSKYTSYDGFISHYSNDINNWLETLCPSLSHEHKLGSILDFILGHSYFERTGDSPDIDLYYALHDSIYLGNYIKKEVIAYDLGYYYSIKEPLRIIDQDDSYLYVINELGGNISYE